MAARIIYKEHGEVAQSTKTSFRIFIALVCYSCAALRVDMLQ